MLNKIFISILILISGGCAKILGGVEARYSTTRPNQIVVDGKSIATQPLNSDVEIMLQLAKNIVLESLAREQNPAIASYQTLNLFAEANERVEGDAKDNLKYLESILSNRTVEGENLRTYDGDAKISFHAKDQAGNTYTGFVMLKYVVDKYVGMPSDSAERAVTARFNRFYFFKNTRVAEIKDSNGNVVVYSNGARSIN